MSLKIIEHSRYRKEPTIRLSPTSGFMNKAMYEELALSEGDRIVFATNGSQYLYVAKASSPNEGLSVSTAGVFSHSKVVNVADCVPSNRTSRWVPVGEVEKAAGKRFHCLMQDLE